MKAGLRDRFLFWSAVRLATDQKGWGETSRWLVARQSSEANYVCLREVAGLPKVGRIPPGVPKKIPQLD